MKRILDVTKVAFYGKTGDDRTPEDIAFPACMASLLETVTGKKENVTIHTDKDYTKRLNNDRALGASGMAFGLLWEKSHCYSALDLTQIMELDKLVQNTFDFAGYSALLLHPYQMDKLEVRKAVVESINRGCPLLGFGLMDPPECAIVTGYDEDGEVILGWSHFQEDAGLAADENGMFRLENWEKNGWLLAAPLTKIEQKFTYEDALEQGLHIMQQTNIDGYPAGDNAYEEWIKSIRSAYELDSQAREELYQYHHAILFNLAELRGYGANFLREAGVLKAADYFQQIHDNCWEADAAANQKGDNGLTSIESCQQIADILSEIQTLDHQAADAIDEFLKSKSKYNQEKRKHFNAIVEEYDRMRPGYPSEMFEEIIKYSGCNNSSKAIEIGAGTGKATVPFLNQGCEVIAIEGSDNMSEFLKKKFDNSEKFSVLTTTFEEAVLENDSYDLIYAASSFHCVDPAIGYPKAYQLLKEGGCLALLRYHRIQEPDTEFYKRIQVLFDKYYHKYYKNGGRPAILNKEELMTPSGIYKSFHTGDLKEFGFKDIAMQFFDVEKSYSADEFVAYQNTYYDYASMPDEYRLPMDEGIRQAIKDNGDVCKAKYIYQLYMGRK